MTIAASALLAYITLDPFLDPMENLLEPQVSGGDCWLASEIAMELDNWANLSSSDQLTLMQAVSDREARRLRLPFRPIVTTRAMPSGTLAQCLGRCIVLNQNYPQEVDSGWLCDRAVLHENYHVLQHAAIDGLYEDREKPDCYPDEQQTINNWEWELSNYKSAPSAPSEYWIQQVEIEARSFSADSVNNIQAEARKEGYICANPAISNKVLL